jgi:AraC-like DNA-binding protein
LAARGECDPQVAHRFGCYQAERWDGEYVYYCPASLVFAVTLVYEGELATDGLVAGPLVMGLVEALADDVDAALLPLLAALPVREAAEVGAFARVQRGLCRALSAPVEDPGARRATGEGAETGPAQPRGLLEPEGPGGGAEEPHRYPVDVERRLVSMVRRGDRTGAAGLINELLAGLYLANNRDFQGLRRDAAELVAVFSRAAIEGGADAAAIFGEKRALDARLAALTSPDELSAFLVAVVDRFVGYVFDFSQFEHANAIRQTTQYVRRHFSGRVSLTEAARRVHLSPNYLGAVFRAETGASFTAYVQQVRIERARKLLASTQDPIAEVATAVGFTDQSYFTKVFAQAVGVTPGEYRRRGVRGG